MKEIIENTQKGKTSCVQGPEELILFKWTYYPKHPIDSMSSLPKY
jgi:hypothetical protein